MKIALKNIDLRHLGAQKTDGPKVLQGGIGERLVRDIAPFGLRMQIDLREKLEREAKINGRSLNSEIVDRLRRSFVSINSSGAVAQPDPVYRLELSELERSLLAAVKKLTPEKQLALISLLK